MISKYKIFYLKILYIFFITLSLNIFFFSTTKVEGKAFEINNIEISKPFEMSFDKNKVIDEGFKKAFSELILLITNSNDQKRVSKIKLNEIKGMVETFSIKEEKFVNETYFVNLGVSFNKKKVFDYLEKKNIFPSIPLKKKFLFIPIIIDENKKDLLLFYKNDFFDEWNNSSKNFHLINYILPTEDLEDLNFIKSRYDFIEQYNFKEITGKYNLQDSIIALFFKNDKDLRVLSRITVAEKVILKNQSFSNINTENIINELKIIYEDYWKSFNQINTSIRLTLNIKINSSNNQKISNFEKDLSNMDLIYNYFVTKFDNNYIYYQIIFNGTPSNFLKSMSRMKHKFDTQNKVWVLK